MNRWTRTLATAVSFMALIVAAPALADLEGRYDVEGRNVGGQGSYTGQAAVQKAGNVYNVAWKIGQQEYVGTGIKSGDVFSVVYDAPAQDTQAGLVVYEIQDDGALLGTWTPLGGTKTGAERWTPVDGQ